MSNRQDERARAPLSVDTDLTLTVNGVEARIESTGERLLVQFSSLPDLLRAVREKPPGLESALGSLLTTTDLTVEVRSRDHIVAVAGADAHPGVVSRLLDVDPVEGRLSGALGAVGAEISNTM